MRCAMILGGLLCGAGAGWTPLVAERDFDGPEPLAGFELVGAGITADGGALRVVSTGRASTWAALELPLERVAGQRVAWRLRVKAQDVTEPADTWNGVKVMLIVDLPGGRDHPATHLYSGTWDWRSVSGQTAIPAEATKVTLVLGLQDSLGTVWFDDLELAVGRPPWSIPADFVKPATVHRGLPFDRGRGFMVGPRFREEDWRDLADKFGVNLVRWQMNWVPMRKAEDWAADIARYDAWFAEQLAETDRALDAARRHQILVLVDLHTPPGGRREGGHCRLFDDARYQEHFLRLWREIATRYRGHPAVWAYDLVNEPVQTTLADGLDDWRALATKAVDVIRAIDPGRTVVVEPTPWGGPAGFDSFAPLSRPNIVYSCHLYLPHEFTHQGVNNQPFGLVYPGEIRGVRWDRDRLREALRPAIEFSRDFGVAMHIGEFSAIRWAPEQSADRYVRDCVELFEELGWDWAYHAFREYEGWSAELSTNRGEKQPPAEPAVRERLLREWFARNQRADLTGGRP